MQSILEHLQKIIYSDLLLQNSREDKVEAHIASLRKIPPEVYFSVATTSKMATANTCRDAVEKLMQIIDIIGKVGVNKIVVFFSGKGEKKMREEFEFQRFEKMRE